MRSTCLTQVAWAKNLLMINTRQRRIHCLLYKVERLSNMAGFRSATSGFKMCPPTLLTWVHPNWAEVC